MMRKALFLLGLWMAVSLGCAPKAPTLYRVEAKRCSQNPLITRHSSYTLPKNITGASVLRVPDWVENPLGTYYMYFASHTGSRIRLAVADSLCGPWRVQPEAVLHLEHTGYDHHIASPDVHVDESGEIFRMFFHGKTQGQIQDSSVAESQDGLRYQVVQEDIPQTYHRVFSWKDETYSLSNLGILFKHVNGEWVRRDSLLIPTVEVEGEFGTRRLRMRHGAVIEHEGALYIFYTRKEDAPERILVSIVVPRGPWTEWAAFEPMEVLRPDRDYEGVGFPLRPSRMGRGVRKQELRDPFVFRDGGRTYLFYSIAGESGIALAELEFIPMEG